MGAALARAVLNAGFDLTVWNRTRAKTEAFGSQGAKISETVLAAAETVDHGVQAWLSYLMILQLLHRIYTQMAAPPRIGAPRAEVATILHPLTGSSGQF
ncbi:NAD(P)-binding domain-containing protein [Defluviimonas aestuarii]|uniref:NAD(P)-binding domain-containing protein n=1 Tax=Albidovulum aestuarii TaxID=1130726 RepID=UPI003B005724